MELIQKYEDALNAIYDHVGFNEVLVVAPIDDCTDKYWSTDGNTVHYADSKEEYESEEGNFFIDGVWKPHFYEQFVYEGSSITMIFCYSQVNGMKWFRLFDNSKRMK